MTVESDHVYFVGDLSALVHNTCVYKSVDSAGNVNYIGITDNPERRAAEHLAQKGIVIDAIEGLENLNRADARAVEQA